MAEFSKHMGTKLSSLSTSTSSTFASHKYTPAFLSPCSKGSQGSAVDRQGTVCGDEEGLTRCGRGNGLMSRRVSLTLDRVYQKLLCTFG
jgi:hypothetical protein